MSLIQQAVNKAKESKVAKSIKLDEDVNNFLEDISKEESIAYSSLVNELLKSVIKNETLGDTMLNDILNKKVNTFVMACNFTDGKSDEFQVCLEQKKAIIGWNMKKEFQSTNMTDIENIKNKSLRDKYLTDGWLDNAKNAIQAHQIFDDEVKKGDYLILKKGSKGIHAIVKVQSDIKCNDQGRVYRDIENIIIFEGTFQKEQALPLYNKYFCEGINKGLPRGTISQCEKEGGSIFSFILEAIQEIK